MLDWIIEPLSLSFMQRALMLGNILGVTMREVWWSLAIAVMGIILVRLFFKELLFYTFDPKGAKASGLPVHWYN
ncbi:MAG: metal ABC transporter permease, partial [Leptolyngbyaceae cyanobacterium]